MELSPLPSSHPHPSILKKWTTLQQLIKEEITLQEIIETHQSANLSNLSHLYTTYYTNKLKSREAGENLSKLKHHSPSLTEFSISKDTERTFADTYDCVYKLLFFLRSNYEYILTLVSILEKANSVHKYETIIDLVCNQFYDNILIPNPEQEELLILCYLLLYREVDKMNCASWGVFLDEEDSFIGSLLAKYANRQEMKMFIISIVDDVIININDERERNFEVDVKKIEYWVDKQKEKGKDKGGDDSKVFELWEMGKSNINNTGKKCEVKLSRDDIVEAIKREEDSYKKEFLLRQVQRMGVDGNVFCNERLMEELNGGIRNQMEVTKKYRDNVVFIKNRIDYIIQSLCDKIATIPYSLRCISKIIHILIKKKFVHLNENEYNAFIGKFIFGKCIIPILTNANMHISIKNQILSTSTKRCLIIISKILHQLFQGNLFEGNIDKHYTVFNAYIVELIPVINNFYQKLIDVDLPHVLNSLLQECNFINTMSLLSTYNKRKYNKSTLPLKHNESHTVEYNYFKEHPDESIYFKCICFSIEDIVHLIDIVYPNISEFSHLYKYSFFQKTIERIYSDEHKISRKDNTNNIRCFYLIFQHEVNEKLLLNNNKQKFTLSSENIKEKIKFCLKPILKGLNIFNTKEYPYLNLSTDTNTFFNSLQSTLENLDESEQESNNSEIPLKWYCQYLLHNTQNLPEEYTQNDYALLYEEILSEEQHNLNNLKTISTLLMTRDGMNIRCAEKVIEKTARDLRKIKQIEMMLKLDDFITNYECSVCIKSEELKDNKLQKTVHHLLKESTTWSHYIPKTIKPYLFFKKQERSKRIELSPQITVYKQTGNSSKSNTIQTIKQFIKEIKKFPHLQSAITNLDSDYALYETFESYLKILKEGLVSYRYIKEDSEKDIDVMKDKIEKYIQCKLYKSVFPLEPQLHDIEFYNKTVALNWITPEHLEIKKLYVSELKYAIEYVKKMDEGQTPYDKLDYLANAYNTINNTLKFSSGKKSDAGAEEMSPIVQYIIIKSQPKMFVSNIQYIKAYLHPDKRKGVYGFLLTQMEFSKDFITEVDCDKLKISKEEYEKNCEESLYIKK